METLTIILDISMSAWGTEETIHPTVIRTSKDNILVDCGFIASLSLIEAALRQHEIEPTEITAIVLTHHDHDHMGAAFAFKNKYPKVKLYASELEAPYISATEKPLRLVQAEEMQKALPPESQAFGYAFCELLRKVEPVNIDVLLHHNDELLESGYHVIATPGHTPGHISLYSRDSSTIIAGDAIALENGYPVIANPQFTLDIERASESMNQLLRLGANTIICYHGGVFPNES